jgi:hypothetical protein
MLSFDIPSMAHCEKKDRLMAAHKTTLERHTVSSNDLYMLRGKTSRAEVDRLMAISSKALADAQETFYALMEHIKAHSC